MDELGDLVPFAIVAAYLFARFFRRKTPGTTAPAPRVQTKRASTAGPTPFEQLLARLEEQRERPGAPVAPPPLPPPPPPPVRREPAMVERERASRAAAKARTESATAFHSTRRPASGAASRIGMSAQHGFEHEARDFDLEARGFDHERLDFEHDRHGFESDNPYSEEALEQARDADRRTSAPGRLAHDPHARPTPDAPPAPPSGPDALAARLRSPQALREAFVLSTVLTRRGRPPRPR